MAERPEGFNTKSVETEALSESELKFGYWFVTHRAGLVKFGIGLLIAFIAVNFAYVIFSLGRFYIFQYTEYQESLATLPLDLVNDDQLRAMNAVLPLEVLDRQVIASSGGRVDIAVRVRNPNSKWSLRSVDYEFSLGGDFYPMQTGFVLPGEEKYFMALNVEGFATGTPQVFFENEQWWRVTNYDQWGPERLNFIPENPTFTPARQTELSGQLPISQASATLTNASAFNYNEIEVQVALLSGNRLAGINKVIVRDFASGESRPIVARWSQNISTVSQVEFIPTVNLIDESVYRDFEGQFDAALFP
jgi:hypothetical protein